MDIDLVALRLAVLGNLTRLRVCRLPVRAGEAGLAMGRIQERLGIPGSNRSHACRALVQVGLIKQVRSGTSLVCRTTCSVMRGLIDDPATECCADAP